MSVRKGKITKLFFASDIHGSEKCWRKIVNAGPFYDVDTVILGGDIVGNGMLFIQKLPSGVWTTDFLGESLQVEGLEALSKLEDKIRTAGYYPYRSTPEEVRELLASPQKQHDLFEDLIKKSISRWLEFAEDKLKNSGRRIIVTHGNNDPLFIDALYEQSSVVHLTNREVIWLDTVHPLLNEGYSNPTPWKTIREMNEEHLYNVLKAQIKKIENPSQAVFNFHAPPYNSALDNAPLSDDGNILRDCGRRYSGRKYVQIGSTAVRKVIEIYQPLLGLHGLVHRALGSIQIGRTLCLNPGSIYAEGLLSGYLVNLDKAGICDFQPVRG